MSNKAIEDYLQAIYEIETEFKHVSTTALAEKMQVKPASATAMLKKLNEMDLVVYQPYQGAVLSPTGTQQALEIIRHRQLIETFLAEMLNVPWDRVYEEAHRMEHAVSEYIAERIDEVLDHPTRCPHGTPIPATDGTTVTRSWIRLSDLQPDQNAVITRVGDTDAELLRYFSTLGIEPQVILTVISVAPYNGPITIRIGNIEQVIGREVARDIFVREM